MFEKIIIEKNIAETAYVQRITSKFPQTKLHYVDQYNTYFGQIKKNYLRKRDDLNLFLAQKKGKLVKMAPDAYGTAGEEHYYYVHAYNCIYECNYCYLQGYFQSPDIVLFVNHDEIIAEMQEVLDQRKDKSKCLWFHAGEFSDTLALSHITQELNEYYQFFKDNPKAKWELRTKSVNIKEILKLAPLENMITSLSLSPESVAKQNDLKTPGTKARINALAKLQEQGHKIAIHLDPIILTDSLEADYQELLFQISQSLDPKNIEYISIGVVRFSNDVYHQVKLNYPDTHYLHRELIQADDGKIKYPTPIRNWMLSQVKQICLDYGIPEKVIYECMETSDTLEQ